MSDKRPQTELTVGRAPVQVVEIQTAKCANQFGCGQCEPFRGIGLADTSDLSARFYRDGTDGWVAGSTVARVAGGVRLEEAQQAVVSNINVFVQGQDAVDWSAFVNREDGTLRVAARLASNAQLSKPDIENGTGNAIAIDTDGEPAAPDTERSGAITGLPTPEEDYRLDMFWEDGVEETAVYSSATFTTDAAPVVGDYEEYNSLSDAVPVLILDSQNEVYAADAGSGLADILTSAITDYSTRVQGSDDIYRMRTDDASGDSPSFPLADFDFDIDACTVQFWLRPGTIDAFDRVFSFMGDGSNRIFCYFSSSPFYVRYRIDESGAIQVSQLQEEPISSDTPLGVCASWENDGGTITLRLSVNGRAVISATGAGTMPSLSDLDIGHESGVEQPDGGNQRVVVWNQALPDADMVVLSGVSSSEGGEGDPGGEGPDINPDYQIPPQDYGTNQLDLAGFPYNIVSAVGSTFTAEIGNGLNQYPLRFRDGNGNSRAWIYGGTIDSNISQTASWSNLYSGSGVNSAGIFISGQPEPTISGLDAVGAWDAIRIRDTADFLVESCYVQTGRDDAIEVDNNGVKGEIRNCLFESMVPVSWTGNNSGEGLLVEDCILKAIAYPYSNQSDVRHFGPIKLRDGSGQWRARRVIIAVDGPRHNTAGPTRMWNKLIATEGLCYYLNLSDTPLSGGYPQPSGGWGTGAGNWELLQGAAARSFYNSERAAWLAANRPYVPSDPRA